MDGQPPEPCWGGWGVAADRLVRVAPEVDGGAVGVIDVADGVARCRSSSKMTWSPRCSAGSAGEVTEPTESSAPSHPTRSSASKRWVSPVRMMMGSPLRLSMRASRRSGGHPPAPSSRRLVTQEPAPRMNQRAVLRRARSRRNLSWSPSRGRVLSPWRVHTAGRRRPGRRGFRAGAVGAAMAPTGCFI